jgi:chemotaxis protein CheZ
MSSVETSNTLTPGDFLTRLGLVAKQLREGLRELGVDQKVSEVAQAIPDARDRLNYIATATERAATSALNAIDLAKPLCSEIGAGASELDGLWQAAMASGQPPEAEVIAATRAYLQDVPKKTGAVDEQLLAIMMAQDFQDLTGQMIKKLMIMVNKADDGLIKLLRDFAPAVAVATAAEPAAACSLENGPQINGQGVSNQQEADDLLASLGL